LANVEESTDVGAVAGDVVAAAWKELLGTAPAQHSDDFFAAGGDSLKAVRLVAAIRDRIGVVVPFRTVFDKSTFGELADVVAEAWAQSAPQ
jgi:mycobactin peptide synthetase MbtE